jgi:hypothetical protein
MAVNLFQVVILAVLAGIVAHVASRWRRGELVFSQFLAWTAFWMAGAAAVTFPDAATRLAHWFGIGRGVDFVMYVSLLAVFYAIFRMLVKIERTNRDITELVRRLALEARLREDGEASARLSGRGGSG